MKLPRIFPLALAHASCDLNQGALPILLPYYITELNISYAAAATIVFSANVVATIAQPLFGYVADRRSRPWLIPLGVLIAGVGFSFAGIAPSYRLVLVAAAVCGLGVAVFHPEGARQAHQLAGEKKATAMSLFTFGGQVGFALGPLVVTALLIASGLAGTVWFALPAVAVSCSLWGRLRSASVHAATLPEVPAAQAVTKGDDAWGAFCCLAAAVLCRSVILFGLNTFIPLYWMNVLGQSKAATGPVLTILLVGGIVGNLLGGRIADRFGYRTSALAEFALLACMLPFILVFASPVWASLLLIPVGLLLSAPNSSLVVLGQGYLPNHIGFSAGVTMGFAFSFGGITTPLLGLIADHHGLRAAIAAVAFLPVCCVLLVAVLPLMHGRRADARASDSREARFPR